jgi:hypothetical protein
MPCLGHGGPEAVQIAVVPARVHSRGGIGEVQRGVHGNAADLGSFEVVKEMRWAPFTLATVFQLGVTTLVPVLPLMLTMICLEELLEKLLRIIF